MKKVDYDHMLWFNSLGQYLGESTTSIMYANTAPATYWSTKFALKEMLKNTLIKGLKFK